MAKDSRQRRRKQAAVEKELVLLNQLINLQLENEALKDALRSVLGLTTDDDKRFHPTCHRAAALLASYGDHPDD